MNLEGNAQAVQELRGRITKIPAIDTTLTKEGWCADAKATGEAIKAVELAANVVSKSGDTMTGSLNMSGNRVLNVGTPTANTDAANKAYVDTVTDGATNSANEYTDTKTTEAKGYVDTNIAEAKGYAATFAKKVSNPRNLLDNSDFSNPVNQRGIADGAVITNAYWIDRWKLVNVGTVTFGDGFITISANKGYPAYLRQHLESPVKFPCTFVVHTLDGVLTCVFNGYNERIDFDNGVGIQNNAENRWDVIIPQDTSVSIENVALYSGEYTAEDLPDYQPKGYGAELAECQRYFYAVRSGTNYTKAGMGIVEASGKFYPNLQIPVPLRTRPTLTYAGAWKVWDGKAAVDITEIAINHSSIMPTDCSDISFGVTAAGLTPGNVYVLANRNDPTAYLWLSADL